MGKEPMINLRTRARLSAPALAALVFAAAMPAAAEVLYVASPNRVAVVDAADGREIAAIDLGHTVFDIAFSADGARAYLAADDGVVEVDAVRHAVRGRLLAGPSFEVELAPDGKRLHVLGNDVEKLANGEQVAGPSRLTTIDLATRQVVSRHQLGRGAEDMIVVGARAAVTRPEEREVALVGLADGAVESRTAFTEKAAGEAAPGLISGLAASPDSKRLYLGQFGDRAAIHVLDLASGARSELPFAHDGFMTAIQVAPDGQALYVATRNHLAILDPATGTERAYVPLGGAHLRMALSPDGRRSYHTLPTRDDAGGAVTVVDLGAGQVERTIPTPGMSPLTVAVRP
jgi:DNA-binding beta-propeller fold protein YncE